MHDRPTEYARCTRALLANRELDGAAGIFDTGLTNALAAIVNRRWPGELLDNRGFIKSANQLLDVVAAGGAENQAGVVQLDDLSPPPAGAEFMGDPREPRPTLVRVSLLREAIGRTQVIRHARDEAVESLDEDHIAALAELNADDALRCNFAEDVDEYEERVGLADAIETARARAYFEALSLDEVERRAAADYEEEYLEIEDGERYKEPSACPVCGLESLIATGYDTFLGHFPAGTCIACSYRKSFDIADLEGREEAINQRVNDPRA